MKYQPALFRLTHWAELIKPVGYSLLLTFGLAFFPIPFWVALLAGLLVGGSAFLRQRYSWVRDTPQCIEITSMGLTVTEKRNVPKSVQWEAVRRVASDDELGGWRVETADQVLRFGVAGLSREGMSAVEAAIRGNSQSYHFAVSEVDVGEEGTAETQIQAANCTDPGGSAQMSGRKSMPPGR